MHLQARFKLAALQPDHTHLGLEQNPLPWPSDLHFLRFRRQERGRQSSRYGSSFVQVASAIAAGSVTCRKDFRTVAAARSRLAASPSLPGLAPDIWKPTPATEVECASAMRINRGHNPLKVAKKVWGGQAALFVDRYSDLLQVRKELNSLAKGMAIPAACSEAEAYRMRRRRLRDAARRLLVSATVSNGELNLEGAPLLGYLPVLYSTGCDEQLVLRANDISALNVAWQYFVNGVKYAFLEHTLHPFFGVYFTLTPVEHFRLLQTWLRDRPEVLVSPMSRALDLGTGCGVITFLLRSCRPQLEVVACDLCPNAVFSVQAELQRWDMVGVKVVLSDLFAGLGEDEAFDVIVFNPPWVPRPPDFEESLSGSVERGNDYPPDLFDRLFKEAPCYLRPGGHLVVLFSDYAQRRGLVEESPLQPFADAQDSKLRLQGIQRRLVAVTERSRHRQTRRDKAWTSLQEHSVELWDFLLPCA